MKKKFIIILLSLVCAIFCALGIAACNSTIKVNSITLNKTELTLNAGETEQLTAVVLPENATHKEVYWSSEDVNIASVDGSGNVTAHSVGTTTITATAGAVSDTCTITVKRPANDISIINAEQKITLVAGSEVTFEVRIWPEDATSEVVWTVDNSNVVSVDEGKITALSQGVAKVTATADEASDSVTVTVTEDGIYYALNTDGLSYIAQNTYVSDGLFNAEDLTDIEIAATFNGKPVTSINRFAFNSINLNSIKIPATVTDIPNEVFVNLPSLVSIEVDENNPEYTTVDGILYNKAVTECLCVPKGKQGVITIPETMTKISDRMFYGHTNLTGVVMHDGITEIGEYAFYRCTTLNSIVIPENVTEIGNYSFYGCQNLWEIYNLSHLRIDLGDEEANGGIGRYALNIIYMKNFPSGIDKRSDGFTFYTARDNKTYLVQYTGDETELVLPADYNGNQYEINKYAFEGDEKLISVTVPNGVTAIGEYAFSNCKRLETVTISDSVTSIGKDAFYVSVNLKNVVLGNGITTINRFTFDHCTNLQSITIQNSVTTIDAGACWDCANLTEIIFNGTQEQWNKIDKFQNWDLGAGEYTVHCTVDNVQ